ncbi:pentapeptide repeat-containing protein [Synechococcus sp. PCC 7336]|uniref:pentapeptide repeat-containing protein n=1 Tax=Synechococcus sp. PCC 7336 TaxID=195250 RepID=UPI0003482CC5|nr:pentapeptide repeat-containing protein [Synechococcus sp. PCC 7336]
MKFKLLPFLLLAGAVTLSPAARAFEREDLNRARQEGVCLGCDLENADLKQFLLGDRPLRSEIRPVRTGVGGVRVPASVSPLRLSQAGLELELLPESALSRAGVRRARGTDEVSPRRARQIAGRRARDIVQREFILDPIARSNIPESRYFFADLDDNLNVPNQSRARQIAQRGDFIIEPLSNINLRNSNLRRADLEGIVLHHPDLMGANLEQANLQGTSLAAADLRQANLVRADFTEANLPNANLAGANGNRADFRQAVLRGANLRGARFERAKLRNADLGRADLRGANLRGADLQFARLEGAVYDNNTVFSAGFNPQRHNMSLVNE